MAYNSQPLPTTSRASSSRLPGTVYNDTVFEKGEATPAQVRFVLSRLSCDNADFFEEYWQAWIEHCRRKGKANEFAKETYVANVLHEDLNEMVAHCPSRPSNAVYGPGSKASQPLVIDDSD